MKVLAVGDIVGLPGVRKVKSELKNIISAEKIDFVIINGENSADGMGITEKILNDLISSGANCITMGNHTWGKKDIFNFIDNKKLLVPANYNKNLPGNRYGIYECNGKKIAVINLIGRVDINVLSDNPFMVIDEILEEIKGKADLIFVDFHAEATAEKVAMGYYLDGRVTAMFGTHTHIQTADEQILEKGSGYITDIGMTGPRKSVIGMNIEASIKRFTTTLPERYKASEGEAQFNGCIFEINDDSCRMISVKRIKS